MRLPILVALAALLTQCGNDYNTNQPPSGGAATGCNGTPLLANSDDPSARGAWPVGARTVMLAGLRTEVWYPATPGSEAGKQTASYDLREHLAPADAAKIPDADNPLQPCDCYRDLPLDTAHGPYPVIVYVHGEGGFRTAAAQITAHWASRGFVVIAADHPGRELKDVIGGSLPPSHQPEEARALVAALGAPAGDMSFVAGHLDMAHLALSGHSSGGNAIADAGDVAQVLIPMASEGVVAGPMLKSTLILGAMDDHFSPYDAQQSGYQSSPPKKRLVGLSNAGHLAFTDVCAIGRDKGGLLKIAADHGIEVSPIVANIAMDGCLPGQLSPERGWVITNAATSAVLEETLQCSAPSTQKMTSMRQTYPEVGDYQEQLQ
jgi:platelet-activating factor acetylhydrolase isoform II